MGVLMVVVAALSGGCGMSWQQRAVVGMDVSIAADMASTYRASDHGRWDQGRHESNPMIGASPTMPELITYDIVASSFLSLASLVLPKWASIPLDVLATGYEVLLVKHNSALSDTSW